jgi:hypothetical protein
MEPMKYRFVKYSLDNYCMVVIHRWRFVYIPIFTCLLFLFAPRKNSNKPSLLYILTISQHTHSLAHIIHTKTHNNVHRHTTPKLQQSVVTTSS